MNNRFIALLLLVSLTAVACDKTATMIIGNNKLEVELAQTEAERSLGLSGRDSLPDRSGMLFTFDTPGYYGFWMKDMKFPLDFIWIRQGKVVQVTPNIPTELGVSDDSLKVYKPDEVIDQVLEVNAGWTLKYGVKPGDAANLTN